MKVLLIIYDNGSYISWFPQGLAYLAAVLEENGHDVVIYNQDVHHYPPEHLTDHLERNYYDIVGASFIGGYYQYQKLKEVSSAVNTASTRGQFKYILGGHMVAPDPKYFLGLTNADCLFVGEGENAILEYIKCLQNADGVKEAVLPAVMKMPEIKDMDSIPMPAYHLFPMDHYRLLRMAHCESTDFVMRILSGRGCPFKCNFCYRRMKGFRPHSHEYITTEMQHLHDFYGINYFSFSDELLMSSEARTKSLCHAFLNLPFKFKWDCNGRLNYATPEVLGLMKQSGCVFINYGIEAMDDQVLKNMDKHLTVEQITVGIENTLAADLSPGFNIIWGNIGDNLETLQKGVDFLLKHDDGSQMRTIRPVTAYPGTPLFDEAVKRGLVKDVEDFYERVHVNSDLVSTNFTDLSDKEFHEALFLANTKLMENYHENKLVKMIDQAGLLYLDEDPEFRGWRQS